MDTNDITYYVVQYSYLGIFIWFFLIDQFAPIPEELVLVTIGYLTHLHPINPFLAGLSALLGLMLIDNIYFYLVFSGNKWIQKLQKNKRAHILQKLQDELQKHQFRTLFFTSFIPKLRFLGPILAGMAKIPFGKFFLINMLGSMTYVAVYVTLGFIFHSSMDQLIAEITTILQVVFVILVIVTLVFFGWHATKKFSN